MRQASTESLFLAALGGTAGIGLSIVIVKSLLGFLPINATGYDIKGTPDVRVTLFTIALTLAGIAFGLLPAVQSTNPDLSSTLKDQPGKERGCGGFQIGFRKVLVALQVALSLVLLIGAGSFVRSLGNIEALDSGYHTAGVLEFNINPGTAGYEPGPQRRVLRSAGRAPRRHAGCAIYRAIRDPGPL